MRFGLRDLDLDLEREREREWTIRASLISEGERERPTLRGVGKTGSELRIGDGDRGL